MECLFCNIVKGDVDKYLLYEDDKVIVILDKFPHSDGHSLIIPKIHYDDVMNIDDDILLHIHNVAKKMIPKLMDSLNSTAITCLVNYGDSQAIKHYHYHLVPNFNYKSPEKSIDEVFKILTKNTD